MAELKYEIVQHLATIAEGSKGWSKELNLVSWNERDPKFDLREWSPDHTKMGKGITLTYEEMQAVCDAFAGPRREPGAVCAGHGAAHGQQ